MHHAEHSVQLLVPPDNEGFVVLVVVELVAVVDQFPDMLAGKQHAVVVVLVSVDDIEELAVEEYL